MGEAEKKGERDLLLRMVQIFNVPKISPYKISLKANET